MEIRNEASERAKAIVQAIERFERQGLPVPEYLSGLAKAAKIQVTSKTEKSKKPELDEAEAAPSKTEPEAEPEAEPEVAPEPPAPESDTGQQANQEQASEPPSGPPAPKPRPGRPPGRRTR